MTELVSDNVTTCRLWRTADNRLVLDGHPDAATLRYGPGDTVHPDDYPAIAVLSAQTGTKQASSVADKQASGPANKSGSGLTVTRRPRGKADRD